MNHKKVLVGYPQISYNGIMMKIVEIYRNWIIDKFYIFEGEFALNNLEIYKMIFDDVFCKHLLSPFLSSYVAVRINGILEIK